LLNLSSAKSGTCRDQTPRKSLKSRPVGEVGLGIDFGQITLSVSGAHEQIALGNNRIVVVNAAGQIHQSDFLF
jgi:hypothetical protein